jgi:hypothetical protein
MHRRKSRPYRDDIEAFVKCAREDEAEEETLEMFAALGKIRMISLRREGNLRGKRLVAVESVRHYLRTLDAQQNQPPSAGFSLQS